MTTNHNSNLLSRRPQVRTAIRLCSLLALTAIVIGAATAQAPARQTGFQAPAFGGQQAAPLKLPTLPAPAPITPNGKIVEDVIARVNDRIITRSEYERARLSLLQEAQQQHVGETELRDHLKDLLRDMIDQQLLLSKGKELNINCDAETIRELDELRKQNHLDSMEALQKAAESQGFSYEDYKENIRKGCITRQVIQEEVGRRLTLTHAAEEAFYNAHAKEFEVPESVHLSEILIPTPENATDAQIAEAQAKADALSAKLKAGAAFAALAKTSSGGPTAAGGGDLGDFGRGKLGDVLENATFPLAVGGDTAPIRTRQGFVILHVDSHQAAGIPPLASVENQVQNALYSEQMQPALRVYLTKARDNAYMNVADGFVDSGATTNKRTGNFAYTAYTAPAIKKKVKNKQRMEQQKAIKAQTELAAAREKVAEKQLAQQAAVAARVQTGGQTKAGLKRASTPVKPKKIRKEKIRYGQAPRNSLPAGSAESATFTPAAVGPTAVAGQAPGVAMAPSETVTSITTGVGAEASADDGDPFAQAAPEKKTRFAAHETQAQEQSAEARLKRASAKATTRPIAATVTQTANEKQQDTSLGLNGDTTKKHKKPKRQKGDAKERLTEQAKPVTTPAPIAPTVNPALSSSPAPTKTPKASSDQTTLPPATTAAPGALPLGQPIPATTSAEPNQPATTPIPH